jgi:hypothetical protein
VAVVFVEACVLGAGDLDLVDADDGVEGEDAAAVEGKGLRVEGLGLGV